MTVHEITPTVDADALLAGAQFADAFRIEINDREIDARRAAERMPTQAFGVGDAEYFTQPSGRIRLPPAMPSLR